jgi:hypothetical protein
LKNRGNRHAKIQIGDIKIEFSGDAHSIEKALQTLETLPDLAAASAVNAKASSLAKASKPKRKPPRQKILDAV